MRIGQIGEMTVVWAKMSSNSSPSSSLVDSVLSDSARNYSASLSPTTNATENATFKSDRSPLDELAAKGIRPNSISISTSSLMPQVATPSVAADKTTTESAQKTSTESSTTAQTAQASTKAQNSSTSNVKS